MAILTEDAFKKQLSAGKIAPITLIFGDDGYLKKRYVDKIVRTVTDPDDPFNFASFGAECDLQDVYDALSQFPMMAEKKCVILCDYDFEHCTKSDLEKLYSLCSEAIDTALFVIWFNRLEIDARKSAKLKKIVTLIEKCGGVAAQCDH
ncbi:MAG: hypothetical protein IJT66_07105, partial [Clostridia bacterium]|nr:hypothetical protein [Clostridia bacterium]